MTKLTLPLGTGETHMRRLFQSRSLDKQLAELRPRLYRLAVSWCSDAMLADDLVQITLNKALLKQEQLEDIDRIEAWLFKIMHNCWMEYLRTKKPAIDIDNVDLTDDDFPEKLYTEQQVVDRVRQAIEILPLMQRQVITLIDLESCSYEQVAVILNIPQGTVMSRLSRARDMLRKRLMGMKVKNQPSEHRSINHLRRVK